MGSIKDRKKTEYCDEVLSEIAFMIQNIHELRGMAEKTYGRESELYLLHSRHLSELADYMDWKLQILATSCPFEWKGLGKDVQDVVSVRAPEASAMPAIGGGDIGG